MTDPAIHRLKNGWASGSMYPRDVTPPAFVYVLNADVVNGSWYLESPSNTPALNDQESTGKLLLSYVNKPWYWERRTNGRPLNRPEMDYYAELSTE